MQIAIDNAFATKTGSPCILLLVSRLRKRMPEYIILAPDIPVSPREALPFLREYCEENKADLIIGTSMGACMPCR
ncbi:hypothetical protein [Prevotella pectinovora]|uniref:hypothetical protein n=1 Tax=Prevotella pectinovora TaxID=1602169 RepID=UPI0012E002DF|nr:hypothetical protein [Prevotella pectinovora]